MSTLICAHYTLVRKQQCPQAQRVSPGTARLNRITAGLRTLSDTSQQGIITTLLGSVQREEPYSTRNIPFMVGWKVQI